MAGSEELRANLSRHAQQRLKLHFSVAVGAGNRGSAGEILVDERTDDARFKLLLEVHDVMREVQVPRDALGVIDVVQGAAAMLRRPVALQFGQTPLVPELHGKADDGAALLLQERGHGGGVHTAGHGNGDKAALGLGALGKSVESGRCVHAISIPAT